MTRISIFLATFLTLFCGHATAQIIPSLPYNLTNGTIADANQVMADFNAIVSATNTNAANAGVNTNITALNGLTTPLSPTSGGSSVYTGGNTGGSGNAQTLLNPTPLGFTLVSGRRVTAIAGFTNSGPTTFNVNSTGAINILKQSPAGLVALAGGEIVVGQAIDVWYDGTQYELFNAAPQSLVPACTVIDYAGVTTPSGYLATDGTTASRATYATLFACITKSGVAASTVNGSPTVTVANSALYQVGWYVGGANVTCNSTITAIPGGGVTLTISNNAGATGATTLTIGPYPQGDCSTTFTLPNYQGRATVMADTAGSTLTSTTCTNPTTLGAQCGTQTKTLVTNNLPAYTPAGSIVSTLGGTMLVGNVAGGAINALVRGDSLGSNAITTFLNASTVTSAFTGTAQGGISTPVSSIAPIQLVTKAIKF